MWPPVYFTEKAHGSLQAFLTYAAKSVCVCVCARAFAFKQNLLFQYLLPLGGREGLQLKTGLVDKYYRQIEVRVPHLKLTAEK